MTARHVNRSADPATVQAVERVDGAAIAELGARGWRIVSFTGGTSARDVCERINRAAGFPDWFGRNLDALHEGLTDLTGPTALVWQGWQDTAVQDPTFWAKLLGMIRDIAGDHPVVLLLAD